MSDDPRGWSTPLRCVVAVMLVIIGYAQGYSTGVTGQAFFADPIRHERTPEWPGETRHAGTAAASWNHLRDAAAADISGDEADSL